MVRRDRIWDGLGTYWDAVGVLLADALSFGLALLEGMLVLEFGAHGGGGAGVWCGLAMWSGAFYALEGAMALEKGDAVDKGGFGCSCRW
jgi:hypothetical protein